MTDQTKAQPRPQPNVQDNPTPAQKQGGNPSPGTSRPPEPKVAGDGTGRVTPDD